MAELGGAASTATFNDGEAEKFGHDFVHFKHNLLQSGLFSDEKLAELIDRYPREYYMITTMTQQGEKPVWRNGDLNGVSGEFAMEAIKQGRLWLCLRRFDIVAPEYDELINDTFADIARQNPGLKTHDHKSSLLISSPGARVLYHADIPMVALWHIRGRKRVWLYDPENKKHLPDEILEGIILRETEEELRFDPAWDKEAKNVVLEPGDALSWAHNAPHRVDNLDELNVSVTTDYFTPATRRRYGVVYANGQMRRRLGIKPRNLDPNGLSAYAKCAAALVAKKAGIGKSSEVAMIQNFKLSHEMPGALVDLPNHEQRPIPQA